MNQDLEAISRQLLVEIVKGNLSAFSVLFMRFYPKVKGYIFALVNDEEISKESVSVSNNINAKNILIYSLILSCVFELLSSSDLESDIDANDMALLIWQYVETMPSRRKEIFKMSRYDGVKADEIAEKLGISKKTVENMLSLALSDIKQYVKKNS